MNRTKDIAEYTEEQIRGLFETDLNNIDEDTWRKMTERAKIGMVFVRDREMMKRISTSTQIRVINLISEDRETRKKYIDIAMPQFRQISEN